MTSTNEVGKFDAMCDSIPLSPVTLPNWVRQSLMAVIRKGNQALFYDGMYVCNDERLNNWLTRHLGLNTSDNWHVLSGGAFTVTFDWRPQVWVIR